MNVGGRGVGQTHSPCQTDAVVCCSRPCPAARSKLIGCSSRIQHRRSGFSHQLAHLVSPPQQHPAPLHRSVSARAKQPADSQDPFVLQSVDDDPAIDALIFEEVCCYFLRGGGIRVTMMSAFVVCNAQLCVLVSSTLTLSTQDTAVMAERALETAAAYVGAAVLFGIGVWLVMGPVAGQEFFAGYLLEQSLSIDNLFVFILVFKYFKYVYPRGVVAQQSKKNHTTISEKPHTNHTPITHPSTHQSHANHIPISPPIRTPVDSQRTVLFWGILTAAVLRLVMIVLGVELIQVFEPLLLIFAGILLFSSYKLLKGADDDEDDDLSDNTIVKLCRYWLVCCVCGCMCGCMCGCTICLGVWFVHGWACHLDHSHTHSLVPTVHNHRDTLTCMYTITNTCTQSHTFVHQNPQACHQGV